MPQVKVRRQGAASGAASVINAALGADYQVTPAGNGEFDVRKSMLIRAHISAHDEADGTVFDVRGVGTGFLVLLFTMQFINNRGIARHIAAALEATGSAPAEAPAAAPAPQAAAAVAAPMVAAPAPGATAVASAPPPAPQAPPPPAGPAPVLSAAGTRAPGGAEPAISVRGLRMRYGSYEAVRGIDFEVGRGEILAFLGPNGAGKTTTVEICEGFRERTSGEVRVLGADPASAGPDWRGRVGVVLQESSPEAMLTVTECLAMYAGYYPKPLPVGRALELVGLTGKANDRCDRLSGGQQRRLDMALALIGDPELVFLDEPTTGFDPTARRAAWDVIAGLRDLGKTIFLTTHYMEEAETLADRILIIAAGQIVAAGTPATIGGRAADATLIRFTLPDGIAEADLPALPAPVSVAKGRLAEVTCERPMEVLGVLAPWALRHGYPLADISVHRPSLEEIYLRLTAEAANGAANGAEATQ